MMRKVLLTAAFALAALTGEVAAQSKCDLTVSYSYPIRTPYSRNIPKEELARYSPLIDRVVASDLLTKAKREAEIRNPIAFFRDLAVGEYEIYLVAEKKTGSISHFKHFCTDGPASVDLEPTDKPGKLAIAGRNIPMMQIGSPGSGAATMIAADSSPGAQPSPAVTESQPQLKQVVLGRLNDRASSLPPPIYPAAAKRAHVRGSVTVDVLVDEEGNVLKANAVAGPPLLKASAVAAALLAKFKPIKLSGFPVRATGFLVYDFPSK